MFMFIAMRISMLSVQRPMLRRPAGLPAEMVRERQDRGVAVAQSRQCVSRTL